MDEWICQHCGVANSESQDLCWFCEMCGCTAREHYCEDQEEELA